MNKFKEGDLVKCIGQNTACGGFVTGDIYTVLEVCTDTLMVERDSKGCSGNGWGLQFFEPIVSASRLTTLPTDSLKRKDFPMLSGCLKYFPAALAGVANVSKIGNDKHNPGEPLHHARGKSMDHGDCIIRHLTDVEDLIAARSRGTAVTDKQITLEVNQLVWRTLAYSQELHESLGAPLAPAAKP